MQNKITISTVSTDYSLWNSWLFALLAFLLVFSPIFRGGNRPLALLIIQVAALGMVTVLLWNPERLRLLPLSIRLVSICALLGIVISLIPIPNNFWLSFSGREIYAAAMRLVDSDNNSWRSISILPMQTEAAWFRVLTAISVFFAVYCLSVAQIQRLVYIVIGVAGCEAVMGIMQYGAGPGSVLRFGETFYGHDAIGTYANRDHLAGFLEMVIPVVLGLLAAELGLDHAIVAQKRKMRRRDFLASIRGQRAVFMGLLSLLLLLGMIFTRSRAGIALAMLSLIVAALAFAWRLGGSNVYGTIGSVIAVLVVLVAEIGLMPILDRFSEDPMQDDRWSIYSTTLDGIVQFFPFGSGAGTFPFVYPPFQPIALGNYFINHAHNDFLEAIFEQGIVGVILIFLGLVLYAIHWQTVWVKKDKWGLFRFVQIGAGIGILMLLLHSLVDFNLQIPANEIFFAFFAGVFFKDYQESTSNRNKRSRRQYSNEQIVQDEPVALIKTEPQPNAVGTARTWKDFGESENPFKDSVSP